MCGVLLPEWTSTAIGRGSSPHVRGFAYYWTMPRPVCRFIPACAGFWPKGADWAGDLQVHPRMCGVLLVAKMADAGAPGSSPHVRGFANELKPSDWQRRFIPACAGFWIIARCSRASTRVHPRMCGVLLKAQAPFEMSTGSSPHVRGFGSPPFRSRRRGRFIPACAGFCDIALFSTLKRWVHPRMCGVLLVALLVKFPDEGSSPHVRGFAEQLMYRVGYRGFIPACAGFCLEGFGNGYQRQVHPRMCGVLASGVEWAQVRQGSSPHVRGFALGEAVTHVRCRFIPACAGFWS